ncbi:MAG: hypothetical protein U0V56_07340 [Actinomycetota bacterium]
MGWQCSWRSVRELRLGDSVDESERCVVSDSLHAHFTNLKQIGCTNCSWVVYSGLVKWRWHGYTFCRSANTNLWVKQAC